MSEIACEGCLVSNRDLHREYRLANPDRTRGYSRRYYKNNKNAVKERASKMREKDKEKIKELHKVWRLKNPEKIKLARQRTNAKTPESIKASKTKYNKANPDIRERNSRKRRAWKCGAPSDSYTSQQILSLYGTDCHLCHEPIDLTAPRSTHYAGWERGLHLDHVIPLSKGGTNLISNIRPSHGLCNLRKNGGLQL
jgi:5-methylcytosine-specific restriction endonuclease McrA